MGIDRDLPAPARPYRAVQFRRTRETHSRPDLGKAEHPSQRRLALGNCFVAHALLRAVFALLRTPFPIFFETKRSRECERGTLKRAPQTTNQRSYNCVSS